MDPGSGIAPLMTLVCSQPDSLASSPGDVVEPEGFAPSPSGLKVRCAAVTPRLQMVRLGRLTRPPSRARGYAPPLRRAGRPAGLADPRLTRQPSCLGTSSRSYGAPVVLLDSPVWQAGALLLRHGRKWKVLVDTARPGRVVERAVLDDQRLDRLKIGRPDGIRTRILGLKVRDP